MHKRHLSDSTAVVRKSDKLTAAIGGGGSGLELRDVTSEGALSSCDSTKDISSAGAGGIEEAEGGGCGNGRSPGTAAIEYEAIRRLK